MESAEKINSDIIDKFQFNQLVDTDAVLKWFTHKSNCSFIQFDSKEFSPSITENILQQTLKFAKLHRNMGKTDQRITNHWHKSLLFSHNNIWKK